MAAAEQMDVPVVIDPGEIARAKPAIFEDRLARTPCCKYASNMPGPRKYSSPSSRTSVR